MKEKEIKQLLKSDPSLLFENDFNVQIIEEEFKCYSEDGSAGRVDFILQINNEIYITEVKGESELKDAVGKVITYSDHIDKRYEDGKKLILAYKIPETIKTTCKKMHLYFYELSSRETNITVNLAKDKELLSDISIRNQYSFLLMIEYLRRMVREYKKYKEGNIDIPEPSRYKIITPSNQSTINLMHEDFSFRYLYFEDPHLLGSQWREYIYDIIRIDNEGSDFRFRVFESKKSPSYIPKDFWDDESSTHFEKGGIYKPFLIVMYNTSSDFYVIFRVSRKPPAISDVQIREYFLRMPGILENLKVSRMGKNDMHIIGNRKLAECTTIVYNGLYMSTFVLPNLHNYRILKEAAKSLLRDICDNETIENSVKRGFDFFLKQSMDADIPLLCSMDL